jgi:hypothetical protein
MFLISLRSSFCHSLTWSFAVGFEEAAGAGAAAAAAEDFPNKENMTT